MVSVNFLKETTRERTLANQVIDGKTMAKGVIICFESINELKSKTSPGIQIPDPILNIIPLIM